MGEVVAGRVPATAEAAGLIFESVATARSKAPESSHRNPAADMGYTVMIAFSPNRSIHMKKE
jgi:hypothetical protein